jgi:rieske iron-sulfur protein
MVSTDTPRMVERSETPGKARRRFLLSMVVAAAGGVAASVLALVKLVVPSKSGGYIPTVKAGDQMVYAEGERKGKPLQAKELQVGDSALVYPAGKEGNYANIVRIIREEPESFQPPTRIDWTAQGIVAYSAVCTHLSCTVSWEKREKVGASIILCHCHNGLYDPLRGAKVLGGPPPRPLPQIPVKISKDGSLIFAGDFSGPVGPLL